MPRPIVSPYQSFRFTNRSFNPQTGEVILGYALDESIKFEERLTLPMPASIAASPEEIDAALFGIHLAAGASYYKTYCPETIVIDKGNLTVDQAAFWNKFYTHGLGEFFYRNDLDFAGRIDFPARFAVETPRRGVSTERVAGKSRVLVPIGGGKDSIVVLESLRSAGFPIDLICVGDHDRIKATAHVADLPITVVSRQIDPKLFDLNANGAYNGHVPITGLNHFILGFYALLHGQSHVAFGNERSANVGNVEFGGLSVNHQYSKSLEFETDFQAYWKDTVGDRVICFSLLRPLSEIAIVERFASIGRPYFSTFASCNKNYRINKNVLPKDGLPPRSSEPQAQRGVRSEVWCGECPKCAFVFSILAPFVSLDEITNIFGTNLFDNEALMPLWRELMGLEGIKPFECVGEPNEVKVGFWLASNQSDYENCLAIQWFKHEVVPMAGNLTELVNQVFTPSSNHAIPTNPRSEKGVSFTEAIGI